MAKASKLPRVAIPETSPPPPGERFFKIRNRVTGKFKTAGVRTDYKGNIDGWSARGKTWDKKSLMGHLALFQRVNEHQRVWIGTKWAKGPLEHPDIAEGAIYYAIPEEYEIIEYFALGQISPLKNIMQSVLAKGGVIMLEPLK